MRHPAILALHTKQKCAHQCKCFTLKKEGMKISNPKSPVVCPRHHIANNCRECITSIAETRYIRTNGQIINRTMIDRHATMVRMLMRIIRRNRGI